VTYDEIFNHEHEFAPNLDKLTLTAAAPVPAGDTGQYPIPLPGINANREY
jgi:hypothetical protein